MYYWDRVVNEMISKNNPNNQFYYIDCESIGVYPLAVCQPMIPLSTKEKYYLGEKYPGIYFTPREKMCMLWFLKGKTNKETAINLGLSMRTIEFYLDNMKEKLRSRTKIELINKVRRSDFLSNFDEEDEDLSI